MLLLNGNFIITITRVSSSTDLQKSKNLKIKRKVNNLSGNVAIYAFNSFDDFCDFCTYIKTANNLNLLITKIKKVVLYKYNSKYYLALNNFRASETILKSFCSSIVEFSSFVNNSNLFESKLLEYGEIIIKHNAISTYLKHFSK